MVAAYNLLDMKINPVQYIDVLNQMDSWIHRREIGRYIIVANVHSVMEFRTNPLFTKAVDQADLVIPDGMPLVVVGRWRGFHLKKRADGPGLMEEAMKISAEKGWRHFFYGGTPETLATFLQRMQNQWPNVQVAGSLAPPFRPLTAEEVKNTSEQINNSHADILWVGLGCPKQEIWISEHHNQLKVPVTLGVGQALDLLAGIKHHAPAWMSNSGLEWLYRLVKEPRRLWKRYLINNSKFIYLVLREEIGFRFKKS
jgi:N-acetylglucosaminyldiphosphoundecaprenol N-acetyl-beta-D-mannosaminyltransferase